MKSLAATAALLLVAACQEIPQDAVKPFAGESEAKPYRAPIYGGDKAAYEKALAKRADTQNEYLRASD
jgi:hypothetical protein